MMLGESRLLIGELEIEEVISRDWAVRLEESPGVDLGWHWARDVVTQGVCAAKEVRNQCQLCIGLNHYRPGRVKVHPRREGHRSRVFELLHF